MSTTIDRPVDTAAPEPAPSATEAFAGRLFESVVAALDLFAVHLGDRLGLYEALHRHGPLTSDELAQRAGIAGRYAREWLEQQAVSDILTVDDAGAAATDRRYGLPEDLVPVLLDPTSPAYTVAVAGIPPAVGAMFERLLPAYRTGEGVSWSDYPPSAMELQGALNRPAFTHELAGWLAAVPAIDQRLERAASRVADVACGVGWSTQAIAARYPQARVDGYDIDDTSVALARRNIAGTGLEDRVRFEVCDLSEPAGTGYDLVTMFEALHDLSHPVQVLTSIKQSLAPDGALLVMDERAAEEFIAPGDPFERLFYGASLVLCLPASLADGGVGTGTAIRPSTVREYADAAGFASCDVLDIEHPLFRFYLLRPPA